MCVLVELKQNPDSGLNEVAKYDILPRNKKPMVLTDSQMWFDTVPSTFFTNWFRFYVSEGLLQINLGRKSLEAAKGV